MCRYRHMDECRKSSDGAGGIWGRVVPSLDWRGGKGIELKEGKKRRGYNLRIISG